MTSSRLYSLFSICVLCGCVFAVRQCVLCFRYVCCVFAVCVVFSLCVCIVFSVCVLCFRYVCCVFALCVLCFRYVCCVFAVCCVFGVCVVFCTYGPPYISDGFQFKYLKCRSLPMSFCCRIFTRATFSDAPHEEVVDAYKYIYRLDARLDSLGFHVIRD